MLAFPEAILSIELSLKIVLHSSKCIKEYNYSLQHVAFTNISTSACNLEKQLVSLRLMFYSYTCRCLVLDIVLLET